MQIRLLGGFEARLGSGELLQLKGRKTQALLAYLALTPGQARSREGLVGLLWSDRGEEQARSSLRQSLSELRKALGDPDNAVLVTGRDTVSLHAETVDVDVPEFERLIDDGTPRALQRAEAIYRGDLLDGIGVNDPAFEDWLRNERQRLNERACEAFSKLLDHQAAEDTEHAVATARRLIALDPLREAAHRALMRIYVGRGERTLALKQYQACCDVLTSELGISPESETERLVEEIRNGSAETGEATAPASGPRAPRADPLPLPDRPSIAVLPFLDMSGDREQDYFADGITGDIITELTRFRSLFVTGTVSSFHYKGQSPKIQDVGRELGVAYVLEGSVRKAGNRVRITAQLVEASTGQHIWAEHYDRELEDIFAVQDDVTGAIVSTLAGHLEEIDRRRVIDKKPEDLAAYDYLLLGDQCLRQLSMDGILQAQQMFQRAIDLEPGSARAYTGLARCYLEELWSDWSTAPEAAAEQAFVLARKAVALDELDGRARVNLATAYYTAKSNFELAEIHFKKALELNPNDADAYCLKGWCHALSGQCEQAINCTDQALRLSPFDIYECRIAQFAAFYAARRYEEAITALGNLLDPGHEINALIAACYAQLDRGSEARQAMADFMKTAEEAIKDDPGNDQQAWRTFWAGWFPFKETTDFNHLLDGFRKAGLSV